MTNCATLQMSWIMQNDARYSRNDWTLTALVGMGPGGPRCGGLVINARNGQALHSVICHLADDRFRSVAVRSSLITIADSLCGYHTASPPTAFRHRFPAPPSSPKDGGTGPFHST